MVVLTSSCLDFLELPPWDLLPEWWHRHSSLSLVCSLPDDLCWILRPSQFHSSRPSLVTVVVPTEIYFRSVISERGWLWTNDTGHAAGCACKRVRGVDHEHGKHQHCCRNHRLMLRPRTALRIRGEQLLPRCPCLVCVHCRVWPWCYWSGLAKST